MIMVTKKVAAKKATGISVKITPKPVKAAKAPSDILKAAIAKADLTQTAAAELMGIHVQNLHRYLSGARPISLRFAKRAETYLGAEVITAAKLIRAQAEYDIANLDSVEI